MTKDSPLYLAAKRVMTTAGPDRYANGSAKPGQGLWVAPFYMGTTGCWAKGIELDKALVELQAAIDTIEKERAG